MKQTFEFAPYLAILLGAYCILTLVILYSAKEGVWAQLFYLLSGLQALVFAGLGIALGWKSSHGALEHANQRADEEKKRADAYSRANLEIFCLAKKIKEISAVPLPPGDQAVDKKAIEEHSRKVTEMKKLAELVLS
ncbi:MAG: hypothetical protein OHK0021_09180 [Bryobacter sp.]